MTQLRTSTKNIYKKIHTVKVVAAPAPANTSEITYIAGPVSEFTVNLVSSNILLNTEDILNIDLKFVFGTGSASGGHSIQFNNDNGNNYGSTTQIRSQQGDTPRSNIQIYNSTQPSDVVEYKMQLRTEFNNNPGAGIVSGQKTLAGLGWTRNSGNFGAAQQNNVFGIWRNSSNNITSIRFFKNAVGSTINIEAGSEIRFYQEIQ